MIKRITIEKYKKLKKNDFVKNILILFSGTSISQILPIIITPVLSRLFNSNDFGIFFLYSSIIAVVAVIATFKYELAIILPKSDQSAIYLLLLSCIISFFLALILYIIILFTGNSVLLFIDTGNIINNWIYFIPLSIMLLGIIQSTSFWLNRKQSFKPISKGRIIKSATSCGVQAPAGYSSFKAYGLIGGLIIGQFLNAVYNIIKSIKLIQFSNFYFSLKRMFRIAYYYRDLPMFNTLSGIINMISNHLPVFLLGKYYGLEAVGLYGMAMRLISSPTGLINQSISEVFYSSASNVFNNNIKEFATLIKRSTIKMIKLFIIPFTLLFIFAPSLFEFILGREWYIAGVYTQIILPWIFILFINSHLTSVITILRKQKEYLIFSGLLLAGRFIALYIGYVIYNNIIYSLIFFSGTGVVFNLFLTLYLIKISGKVKQK